MKSKQILGIALTLFLIATMQPSQAVSLDQEQVTFVLKDKHFSSKGTLLKGINTSNPDSRFELIASSLVNTRDVLRLYGSPNITQTVDEISVNGTLNGYNTHALSYRNSFLQKDSYFPNIPVNERIVRTDSIFRDNSYSFDLDRTFQINMTYDELDNDGNFTKIINAEHQVDIFVLRYFNARVVAVNDTDGNLLGRVYGFNIFISINIFDSNDHAYVAYHGVLDFGYGNMLPDRVNTYLGILSAEVTSRNSDRIVNDTRPGPLSKISWFDLGYNETLGLDMLFGFYNLERNSRTIVLPRATTTTTLGLNNLELNQDTSLEMLVDEISIGQQLAGFDDADLESIDNELLDVTLVEDDLTLENAFQEDDVSSISSNDLTSEDDPSELPVNTFYIILPIALIPFLRRKLSQK